MGDFAMMRRNAKARVFAYRGGRFRRRHEVGIGRAEKLRLCPIWWPLGRGGVVASAPAGFRQGERGGGKLKTGEPENLGTCDGHPSSRQFFRFSEFQVFAPPRIFALADRRGVWVNQLFRFSGFQILRFLLGQRLRRNHARMQPDIAPLLPEGVPPLARAFGGI